jgi:hypothetical protein
MTSTWARALLVLATAASACAIPCVASAQAPAPGSPTEKAFREYVRLTGLAPRAEPFSGTIPCAAEECVILGLGGLPREEAMKLFPQVAGGFGIGTEVVEAWLKTDLQEWRLSNIGLVVHPGRTALALEIIKERAGRLMGFLRLLARMSRSTGEAFNPLKTGKEERIYFIASIVIERSFDSLSATLLGPPQAPPPDRRAAGGFGACEEVTVQERGEAVAGDFKGWKRYSVASRWICTGPDKSLH